MKVTRNVAITGKKLFTLLLLASMVAPLVVTVITNNLNGHGAATIKQYKEETLSLRPVASVLANWIRITNGSITSSPTIGDVDGDRKLEVVVGSHDGRVYCLNGITGSSKWVYQTQDSIESSPVIVDVDRDGRNEVIFGSNDWNIYCLNSSGRPKWKYTTGGAVVSSPVIAPLYGGNSYYIMIGSYDNKTYCLNCAGGLEWNYTSRGPVLTTPALGDPDGDGRIEVVIGSWDKNVYCLDETGKVKWNYTTGDVIYSSPAIGDLDRDARGEVVIGSCDKNIYCLNETGGLMWTYAAGDAVRSSPAIIDVNDDNQMEVIVGSDDYNVYCLTGKGGLKWKFNAGSAVSCHPAVGDVDGDTWKEVVVGSWSGWIFCLNRYGLSICSYPIGGTYSSADTFVSSPAIADVNGDKLGEVVVGSENHYIYCLSVSRGAIGTLVIIVSDTSTGSRIQGACVFSTYQPQGQPPLYDFTSWNGSVIFRDIIPGEYYIGVNGTGFSCAPRYVYVGINQTTTEPFWITTVTPTVNTVPVFGIIAGIAFGSLLLILVLRQVAQGGTQGGDIPTYSYEDTTERDRHSEVTEEPDRPVLSPQICPHCGATYMRPDASYCWNCGAGLAEESDTSTIKGRKKGPLATVGRCMVCGLDVKEGENVIRCPFCGNIAHRTHMLEWLHTRNYCPGCYHHLDERDVGSTHR